MLVQCGWLQAGKTFMAPPTGFPFLTMYIIYFDPTHVPPAPEAVINNTLDAHSEWLHTQMGVGATSTTERGIQRNGLWRQDASLVVNSIMELQTHNCFLKV